MSTIQPTATQPEIPGAKRTRLSWALLLLPWLVLAVDLGMFPFILGPGAQFPWEKTEISSLLVQRRVFGGNVKGYRVYVSVDNLNDPRYLRHLSSRGGNALAISHYVSPGEEGSSSGSLGRALLARLRQVSPVDHAALVDLLQRIDRRSPGDVVDLGLHIPEDRYGSFPIDRLFIVVLERYDEEEKWETLSKGLTKLFRQLDEKDVSSLVLPCLGYQWEWKDDHFADYFESVSKAVQEPARPHNIYLSLYSEWPTFVLEEAISSLNSEHFALAVASEGSSFLYRGDLRLLLLLLPLCLLVCSAYVPIDFKNFMLITVGLTACLLGSVQLIRFFSQGFSSVWRFVAQVVVWIVLAALFPLLAALDPMDLFKGKKET